MWSIIQNNKVEIEKQNFERITINDEWDVNEICDNIIKYKHAMIRADLQGSGKTYACKHLSELGYKVLFVCPTNKLAQNNHGITINKFFGMTIDNEETLTKVDASQFDVIVFGEMYFVDIYKLSKIKNFVDNNKDKIIIATGDTSQLEPINEYSNQKKMNMLTNVLLLSSLRNFSE